MSNPTRPLAPASKPAVIAEAPAYDVASIEVTSGITVESNDVVGTARPAALPSVIIDHPVGIQVETFMGLQPDVAWIDPNEPAPAGAE